MSASRGIEFIKIIFDRTRNSSTFGRCLKNVKLVSAKSGICEAEFIVDEEHLNLGGTLHGGFTSTLVDCVSTYALMSQGNGVPGVSVDLHVTFMKAAFPGDNVLINASLIKSGRNIAFLEVELKKKEDGAIIARGQHTKFIPT